MSTPTPTAPKIYTHPSPRQTLLPHLLPLLPYTLPLVRRIQFHFHSPHARVLSTFAPETTTPIVHPDRYIPIPHRGIANHDATSTSTIETKTETETETKEDIPFLAAYLDRSRAPETECWLFSSVELPASGSSLSIPVRERARAQVRALLAYVREVPLPGGFPAGRPGELVLVGSLHWRVLEMLKGEGRGEGKVVESRLVGRGGGVGGGEEGGEGGGGEGDGHGDGGGKGDMIAAVEANPTKDLIHGSTDPTGANARGYVKGHTVPTMKFLFAPRLCTDPRFVGDGLGLRNGDTEGLRNGDAEGVQGAGENGGKGKKGVGVGMVLPAGLEWDTVRDAEYALVKSRTAIPRLERTMRLLGSVGVRRVVASGGGRGETRAATSGSEAGAEGAVGKTGAGGAVAKTRAEGAVGKTGTENAVGSREGQEESRGELIAWAFLGPDGSLTTLHVEPAFRGRGIAKVLTRRLFGLLAPGAGEGVGGAVEGGGEEKGRERAGGTGNVRGIEGVGYAGGVEVAGGGGGNTAGGVGGAGVGGAGGLNPHPSNEEGKPGHDHLPPSGFLDIAPGQEWAHSDVSIDNVESAGVARSLGGEEGWWVFWTWVDLGRVV